MLIISYLKASQAQLIINLIFSNSFYKLSTNQLSKKYSRFHNQEIYSKSNPSTILIGPDHSSKFKFELFRNFLLPKFLTEKHSNLNRFIALNRFARVNTEPTGNFSSIFNCTKMNSLIKSLSTQLIRHHRQFLIQSSYFATDLKKIEELTKKNKVVVFMKVEFKKSLN